MTGAVLEFIGMFWLGMLAFGGVLFLLSSAVAAGRGRDRQAPAEGVGA